MTSPRYTRSSARRTVTFLLVLPILTAALVLWRKRDLDARRQLNTCADWFKRESSKPLIAYFWATWSGPARRVAPAFDRASRRNPHLEFVKVDVDPRPAVSRACAVRTVPALRVIEGRVITLAVDSVTADKFVGAVNAVGATLLRPEMTPNGWTRRGIVDTVRAIVAQTIKPTRVLGDTDRLVEQHGADSLDIVELIITVEKRFDIDIPDEDSDAVTCSVASLADAVAAEIVRKRHFTSK